MASAEYLFVHPWLDKDEGWAGFQIGYWGSPENYSAALSALAAQPGMQAMDQRLPWFVPIPAPAFATAISDLPEERSILMLPSPFPGDERDAWSKLESDLRQSGRRLAATIAPDAPLPASGAWEYVILAASHARTLPPYHLAGLATRTAVGLTGLHARSDFTWAAANSCSLFGPEYLLNRSLAGGNRPDMTRLRLLKLLALIVEDADTATLEAVFREEPKLAYGLLRLVNSAAMAPRTHIASFGQAIALLGRKQLQRWLQLLIYADPNNDQRPNPLLLIAAERGRLVEILSSRLDGPEWRLPPDMPFMIGTFSLLDVLLNLSMPDVLLQLPVPEAVHLALEEHRGSFGQLLTALGAADNRDYETAAGLLAGLGIDGETFMIAQMEALAWANSIQTAAA